METRGLCGVIGLTFLAVASLAGCGDGESDSLQIPSCRLPAPKLEQHGGFRSTVQSCQDEECDSNESEMTTCRFLTHSLTIEVLDAWGLVFSTDEIGNETCRGKGMFTFASRNIDAQCELTQSQVKRTAERTLADGSLTPIEQPCSNLVPPLLPDGFCP